MSVTRLPLLFLAILPLLLSVSVASSADVDSLVFSVDPSSPVSPAISPNLVCFSIEVWDFTRWTDRYPAPPKQSWLNLMKQLMRTPNAEGPRYRIGGDSADLTVFNHTVLPPLPGRRPLMYSVNETDLLTWKQAMVALNSVMTLDLNFRRGDNATWAVEYVAGIDSVIGWEYVTALEVGNEVDLYGGGEKYRPSNYSYQQYKSEYEYYVQAIQAAVPTVPTRIFQGLVNIAWENLGQNLNDYLSSSTIEQSLYSISQHDYPVPSCVGNNVTIADILDDTHASSTSTFLTQHDTIATLAAHNISFVIGEGSDAVCNGEGPMVLNTFSTALWVVDQLFQAAAVGVEHWYFHSWGTDTATFSVIVYGNKAAPDRFLVQPIYYGLRMFAMATAHHTRLIKLATTTSTNSHIHAYAMVDTIHRLNVAVVHKDLSTTQPCNVSFSLPFKQAVNATLIRLLAPSIDSEYGVTLAGQTYDGSVDGMPMGDWVDETLVGVLTATGTVQFDFVIQPLSAVLLGLSLDSADEPELLKMFATATE